MHLGNHRNARSYHEYKSFTNHPVYGSIHYATPQLCIFALLSHETAHWAQRSQRVKHQLFGQQDLRNPHGWGWKQLYRHVRESLVNPLALPGCIGKAPTEPPLDAIRQAMPFDIEWITDAAGITHAVIEGNVTVRLASRTIRRQGEMLCTRQPLWRLQVGDVNESKVCPHCLDIAIAFRTQTLFTSLVGYP